MPDIGKRCGVEGPFLWKGRVLPNFRTKGLLPIKYQVILQLFISIGDLTDLGITMNASLGRKYVLL